MSAEVAAYLEREIASRGLKPGDKLPTERELAAQLSVSRGTVRAALQDLASKHLLERTPGRGTLVAQPPAAVSELYARLANVDQAQQDVAELRGSLEPLVAELAALRSSAADLIQLQDVLNGSNEHLSPEEALRLDIEFHTLLAQAARNQLMATVLTMTSSWTSEVRLRSHSTIEGRRTSIEGHRHILEAIQSRDATGAGIAMRDHLADVAILISAKPHHHEH
jgi:GntR family transcriptional repressor for pyruvate dehydrogenase complex